MQLSEQSCAELVKRDIKRRERESRDERGGDKRYAVESRISQSLQDLFESREGRSCSDRALEVVPPSGKKRRVWIAVSEQAALPENHHLRNTAEEGQMGSNKAVPVRRADPADSL